VAVKHNREFARLKNCMVMHQPILVQSPRPVGSIEEKDDACICCYRCEGPSSP
jgi:hypothetical protein